MIQKKPSGDTVIEEIHRTRERIAEKFGGNIAAILEDARKRQAVSGRVVWQGPGKMGKEEPVGVRPRNEYGSLIHGAIAC
jgi:hypothetical protein